MKKQFLLTVSVSPVTFGEGICKHNKSPVANLTVFKNCISPKESTNNTGRVVIT